MFAVRPSSEHCRDQARTNRIRPSPRRLSDMRPGILHGVCPGWRKRLYMSCSQKGTGYSV